MKNAGINWPASLLLFGAGKMGGAMLEGWLKTGMPGDAITIIDPNISHSVTAHAKAHGCHINPAEGKNAAKQVVVLAIKPQMLDAASVTLEPVVSPDTLIISIMAGKTIADMKARIPAATSFIRAMPNTPAAVGRGITGVATSPSVSAEQKALAQGLLEAVGKVEWLSSEAEIDIVTAVSGSGPAYVFYLVECLAKAGEAAGLDQDIAMRLARATIEGAGELMFQDPATPASILRQNVTSPGGTTAAALEILMADNGLAPLMQSAVAAAKRRAGELSG